MSAFGLSLPQPGTLNSTRQRLVSELGIHLFDFSAGREGEGRGRESINKVRDATISHSVLVHYSSLSLNFFCI